MTPAHAVRLATLALVALGALDCSSAPATRSPLRTPGACMMPWPNAIQLASDPSTPPGFRFALTFRPARHAAARAPSVA